MDTSHFAALLRSLASTPSRRGLARALTGSALAGALIPAVGFTEAFAKKNKQKKRRRRKKRRQKDQPFCTGKSVCVDGAEAARCDAGSGEFGCGCLVAAETGDPFCAGGWMLTLSCGACSPGETCVALGGNCEDGMACAIPCANPL